jgi:hypothetical protein
MIGLIMNFITKHKISLLKSSEDTEERFSTSRPFSKEN